MYSIIKCITLLSSRVTDLHFSQAFVDLNVNIAETHKIITIFCFFCITVSDIGIHFCIPKYLEFIFAGSMKGFTTSSVEDGRKKVAFFSSWHFSSLFYFCLSSISSYTDYVAWLSFFCSFEFPIFKDFRFSGNGPVSLSISSRAEEDHQSTGYIWGCTRNIKDTSHSLLSFRDFFINSSKRGRLYPPCGRQKVKTKNFCIR